jgi:ABC-type transport system involved in multi-copper enzyme maturation permease subunit
MIWWKEWRETRFGFLTAIVLVGGLYLSMPSGRQVADPISLFLGIFAMFFGSAMAIALGATAISGEVGADTMPFLLSKPVKKSRLLTAKYVVRGLEATLVYLIPVLSMIGYDNLDGWEWVPPYIIQKYLLIGALSVLFIFSATFLFSILFKKPIYSVLAGVVMLGAYLSSIGGTILKATYNLERVDPYFGPLILFCAAMFAASLFLFKVRDY